MTISRLKSPYSWFGGKSRVAPIIWNGLGKVSNYIEPFAGSLAVLLANPNIPKIETINELDHCVSNFWRAVAKDPELVANFASFPVMQVDLHARHRWLINNLTDEFKAKMEHDPDFFDAKIAGYWIYGQCASIGNNWLQPKGLNASPLLSSAGGGIHGMTLPVLEWFKKLQERTRRVRVCCGDWSKVITPSITYASKGIGDKDITGVFLDSPYSFNKRSKVYREENDIYQQVCKWAVDNGNNSRMRIVVCGYDGDYKFPYDWKEVNWITGGGLSSLGFSQGKLNTKREKIYFSPHCLNVPNNIGTSV
jgi:DNA adenine methylase